MSEYVLPRARARRRRRRPFGPSEWLALYFVITGSFVAATCLVVMVVRDLPHGRIPIVALEGLVVVEGSLYVCIGWPTLVAWWQQ